MPGNGEPAASERRLHASLGIAPTERFVDLANLGCRVRVQEAGAGPAVVFVHGAMTAGTSWVNLVAELPEFRCILLDRPGCGGSELPAGDLSSLAAKERVGDLLVADLLDGLGLETAHLVTNSLGGWYGFRSAAAHPDRIDRIVAMGFQVGAAIQDAPMIMRVRPPAFIAKRRPPFGGRRMVRSMLKQSGMRAAIESGAFDDVMLDWMAALIRNTDTMPNEMASAPPPITLRGPVLETQHSADLLARVTAPVHLFWGDADLFGGEDVARGFASLLPDATVEIVPGGEHAPWLDAPDAAVAAVRAHLGP